MRTTYDPIKTSERLKILKLQLAAKFKQNSPTYIHKALHERTMPTQFGGKKTTDLAVSVINKIATE